MSSKLVCWNLLYCIAVICTYFSKATNQQGFKNTHSKLFFGAPVRHVLLHVYTPIKTRVLLVIVNINKGATQLHLCPSDISALLLTKAPFSASIIDENAPP